MAPDSRDVETLDNVSAKLTMGCGDPQTSASTQTY